MVLPPNILLVSEIAGKKAVLKISSPTMPELQKALDLGFTPKEGKLTRAISGHEERIEIVRKLIAAGALFIGGAGWSPAEVVAQYKDEGRISESYRVIVWKGPQEYEIRDGQS